MNINEFKYIVLDQRSTLKPEAKALQNELYTYWSNYWNGILRSVGIQESIASSEFYNQHKITAIYYQDEIVTMHLLSFFKKEDYETTSYLTKFNLELKTYFLNSQLQSFMTLQYLSFDTKWKTRKEKPFIFLPMVIACLSLRHQQVEDMQAIVSVARKDLGASNSLVKMNFDSFIPDGLHNNTPVSYKLALVPCEYPNEEVREVAAKLWNNKNSGNTKKQPWRVSMIEKAFETKFMEISNFLDQYPFENAKATHRFLSQQYYLIQNSTRYEAIGASLLPLTEKEEFNHRIMHLTGEFAHDDLIVEDLKNMGFTELEPMYPQTRALISAIYYELQHYGPDALFGISLLLEGLSTKQCAKLGKRLFKSFDVESQYLKIHDEADAVHYPETMAMIKGFTPERQKVVLNNLELSFFLYSSILQECLKRSQTETQRGTDGTTAA